MFDIDLRALEAHTAWSAETLRTSRPRSTADTAVIVRRAQAFEQRDGFRERLHPLHGAIRHIDGGLAGATHRLHISAPGLSPSECRDQRRTRGAVSSPARREYTPPTRRALRPCDRR